MKTFRGFRAQHSIAGDELDSYYKLLPGHDLGALANYFWRVVKNRNINICLDIGANIGLSSLIMAEISPRSQIVSFEPSRKTFDFLRRNVDNNLYSSSIEIHQTAVGAREGRVKFVEHSDNAAGNHISISDDGVEVPLVSLDHFLSTKSGLSIDFIKIDVEGFEIDVLKGAEKTIFANKPIVFIEFNPYSIRKAGIYSVEDCLKIYCSFLGPLGVVDRLTGETTPLPVDQSEACKTLSNMSENDFSVFDLANLSA